MRKQIHINKSTIDLIPTNLGLTNDIYKGIYQDTEVAIRIPKEKTKHLSSFNNEKFIIPFIQTLNLDVEQLYYDPDSRIKITKWVIGANDYDSCMDEDKIIRAARLIKKLHNASYISHNEFNPLSLYNEYQSQIISPLFDLSQFHFILDEMKKINNPHILCHNDLVSGNFLFTPSKDYLIDYEYAKDNDPLFDVMSFLTENQITDPLQRSIFYSEYFDQTPSDKTLQDLSIYESFHNLLWCSWANMMYDLYHQDDYLSIANQKYNALITSCNLIKRDS